MKFDRILNYYLSQVGLYEENREINIADEQENLNAQSQLILLLPLEKTIIFPGLISHFRLSQSKAKWLEKKIKENLPLGIIGTKAGKRSNKTNLQSIGTLVSVQKIIHLPDHQESLIVVQGKVRFTLDEVMEKKYCYEARITPILMKISLSKKTTTLVKTLKQVATELFHQLSDIPKETLKIIEEVEDLPFLTSYIATNISDTEEKQALLNINSYWKRAKRLLQYMMGQLEIIKIKHSIQQQVSYNLNQRHKGHVLREHIKVLQEELGERGEEEIEELTNRIHQKKIPFLVQDHLLKQVKRIERSLPHAPEYSNVMNYIQTVLELPWGALTKDKKNLPQAQKMLDKNHHGMEKIKERIIEYLAVRQLRGSNPKLILCLVGPPGVGKTTLCHSIAEALGRKVVKMSLGGLHDEAEIRGNRRVYLGAQPGKAIQLLQKAGSSNPVFILDEIDKIDKRYGDPASALLELLDPSQNHAFVDNYLEIPYDFSQVLFIATANSLSPIPEALEDRMEFLFLEGYASEEKTAIAKQHLLPMQRKAHGLKASDLTLRPGIIEEIIDQYTMEAGVRHLNLQLGTLARKTSKKKVMQEPFVKTIDQKNMRKLLGPPKIFRDLYQDPIRPGVAIGLAWTGVGGDILFIETALTKGEGKLTLSGQLGEVMEESATAAYTYLKSQAAILQIDPQIFVKYDLHIHLPDGATFKDGPSAGTALFTALASLYTQRKVQKYIAMSGEITLRGLVLPVGGIKEKLLAAKRAGIKRIFLPKKNEIDVQQISSRYLKELTINYVEQTNELLLKALESNPVDNAIEWDFTSLGKQSKES